MNRSDTLAELAKAMAKAQAEIKPAIKDSENPQFKGAKYADLASVWDACREPLTKNGLSVVQSTRMEGVAVIIETLLLHSSGEYIAGEISLPPTKIDPQGQGSAMTYARRYALAAMVGVAPEDDDGNDGSKGGGKAQNTPTQEINTPAGKPLPPAGHMKETQPTASLAKNAAEHNANIAKPPTMQEWAAGFIDKIKAADSQEALAVLFNRASKGLAAIQKASPGLYASIIEADEKRRSDLRFPPDPMAGFDDSVPF